MTTNLERSRSLPRNRFGQLSKNMFFARHVAQPRYLNFITGAAGQRICHVREKPLVIPVPMLGDLTKPLLTDPRFNIEFPPNSYNETLLQSYTQRLQVKKHRERLLPPIPGWNPAGTIVEDTENWRRELAHIAEMIGLVTSDELVELETCKSIPATSVIRSPLTTTGQYSRQSGRWNETPKSANRGRLLHRRILRNTHVPNNLLCVDEHEREVWMLQVLCQILKTENINEIQSWLVSSGPSEKEAVRQLITKAIKGLEENGRIQPSACENENAKAIQVNMDTFGSLLAAKFPNVSSSIPITPSKPMSRPKTSPEFKSQTEFQNKTAAIVPSIDETTEVNMPQPTKVDLQRDIQILTLADNDNEHHPMEYRENEQVPF